MQVTEQTIVYYPDTLIPKISFELSIIEMSQCSVYHRKVYTTEQILLLEPVNVQLVQCPAEKVGDEECRTGHSVCLPYDQPPKMSIYPVPLRIDRQNYHLRFEEE